ncbi:MAG: hypothetical protein U1F43_24005 [Myxococcota bacterium]
MSATVIIPPARSVGTAVMAVIGALATAALSVALVLDPAVPSSASGWLILLAGFFAGATGLVAFKLAQAKGGLYLDEAGQRIGLGVTSSRDVWWIPRGEIRGVRTALEPRTERWLVVLEATGRPPIVVAAAEERGQIIDITNLLAQHTRLSVLDEEPDPAPTGLASSVRFGVRRGAALQGLLAAMGLALISIAMVTFFQDDRFAALLLGPLLVVVGLVLIAVTVVKRFATEELASTGASFTHAFVFRGFRWGERTIRAPRPAWRIWLSGMRGAHLEVLGADATLVVGAGATSTSRIDLDALARLSQSFEGPPEAG